MLFPSRQNTRNFFLLGRRLTVVTYCVRYSKIIGPMSRETPETISEIIVGVQPESGLVNISKGNSSTDVVLIMRIKAIFLVLRVVSAI